MSRFAKRAVLSFFLAPVTLMLSGCPGFSEALEDVRSAFRGAAYELYRQEHSAPGLTASSLSSTATSGATAGRQSLEVAEASGGALLVARDPSSNRVLVAEEGVGRWATFSPTGIDSRVALGGIVLRADGQTILAATPIGILVSSLATGSGRLAAGTAGVELFDLICTDPATLNCLATAFGRDTANAIHRSTDGGESWTVGGAGLPTGDNGNLTVLVSPSSGTVLAGSYGNGVFRSTDGGASWSKAGSGLPQGAGIQQLVAGAGAIYAGTDTGVFKSADVGSTFTPLTGGLPLTASPRGMAFRDGSLFVAMDDYYNAGAGGLWKSGNGGSTFTDVGKSIPAVRFLSVLATAQAVYAGTSSGIYRSLDAGATWAPYNEGLNFPDTRAVATSGDAVYQGVYEGLNGVYRSNDEGRTWRPGDDVLRGLAVTSLAASGSVVIAATDVATSARGLLRSTDGGATWRPANAGITLPAGSGFRCVVASGNAFYAGGLDGGGLRAALYRSSDSGASWASIGASIPDTSGIGVTSVFVQGSLLLAGSKDGLFRSTDGGTSWSPRVAVTTGGYFDRVSSFASLGGNLYAGLDTGGVAAPGADLLYVSRDQGATWSAVAGKVPTSSVNALAVSGSTLYAGTSNGVQRTTDGGATWSVFGFGIGEVRALALGPATLYAGLRGDGLREVPLERRTTRLVPIVLDVDTGSAHYATELVLSSTGNVPSAVTLRYTASIGTKEGSGTVSETLGAGQQLVIPDAISYLRGKGLAIPAQGAQGGTLLVTFSGFAEKSTVSALARTATATQAPQPVGRAGLAYSGLAPEQGSTTSLTLYGLRSNASDRSNVAIFSMSDQPVTVRVTAFSGDADKGVSVVADGLELPAYGWTQLSGILQTAGFANGYVTVERVSESGTFSIYGVINDQGTNDGSYVLPVVGNESLRFLSVPVLVEAGAFVSELVFANRSDEPATFDLTYVESLNGVGGGGAARVTLGAREQRIVPDALGFLRSSGVSLPPKGSGGFAGTLRVRVSGPSVGKTFVGARTASQSSGGGQFGLFTPGTFGGDDATWQSVFIYGLRADASNRSNVAVFNTGGISATAITLELQAYDGDAGGVAKGAPLTVTLGPGQWSQPSGFFAASGVKNGWVKVTRKSGLASWGAYGVVNDGGAPGERTGDGAYVPSSF